MRRIMWTAIGFTSACAVGAWLLARNFMLPLALLLLVAGLGIGIYGRDSVPLRRIAYACIGGAFGFLWFVTYSQGYLNQVVDLDGQQITTNIYVTDYSYETDYGSAVDGELTLSGKSYRIRVYLNDDVSLSPSDTVTGNFLLRLATQGSASGATYHQGEGIFLLGYQRGEVTITNGTQAHLKDMPAILRQKILLAIRGAFPNDTYAFAQALLLGESYDLDYQTETAFKISGIRHIIAVSGLHISILYGFLSLITFKRRYLTALIGAPILLLFAAVAGFTPSVTRACIMVFLMMAATAFRKEYDGATALAFASLVMLIVNPLIITSVSFQLSVGSVAGIYLFSGKIANWANQCLGSPKGRTLRAKLTHFLTSSLSVSLSAMSITTPLCAYYFGAVSIVGVLTNLLTLWAVSFIFYGIMAVCVLYAWSAIAASRIAAVISVLIRYVLFVSKTLASLPLAAVYTKSAYIVIWLCFVYLLLAIFLIMKKKHPFTLICCGVIALCVALGASWLEPLMNECRVTVLDVGQGQSILLQSEGHTFLVDCGGSDAEQASDIASETLLSQGIHELDGVILTHYDADHAGGTADLLSRVDTKLLLIPEKGDEDVVGEITNATRGTVVPIGEKTVLTFGEAKITIYPPTFYGESNENSLCVLFETPKCAILITGDRSSFGEQMLLRVAELPKVDLLIAGHHGSKNSTSEALLDVIKPSTVIISVGKNAYGHPSQEVLDRLAEHGCTVYRTDEYGTVIFRR